MTKQEFLYGLRDTLANALPPSQVEEHVRYYENYIDEQIALGYSEAQVMAELGNGRSIAHNIIDGIEAAGNGSSNNGDYQSEAFYADDESSRSGINDDTINKLKSYGKIAIVLLIVFVVLIAVTRLIILALPTIITFAVIMWILKKINGR